MIKKVIKTIKKVFIPRSESIDETPKKVEVKKDNHLGIPAPVVTPNDSWFEEAPKTEKVIEYVMKKNEELYQRLAEEPKSKEVDNIHQVMYDKATKGIATTLALNPQFQGGSENFQKDWNSGTGMNQFRG